VVEQTLDELKVLLVEFNPALKPERIDGDATIVGGDLGLDSIMLVGLITRIEERFNFVFAEEDLSHETFANVSVLATFISSRRPNGSS